MKVKALKPGYYGLKRIKKDEEFVISDEKNPIDMVIKDLKGLPTLDKAGNPIPHPRAGKLKDFSEKWMEPVNGVNAHEVDDVEPGTAGDEIAPRKPRGRPRRIES